MSLTCEHAIHMPTMIQLRNVPDDLHRRLKARAAMAGMSLSDFLIAEVARVAERPTPQEMLDRLHTRTPVEPRVSPVLAVRAARDAR
jgi:antitoxin FitA